MPRAVLYPEWLDENGARKYPFADNATLTNQTDVFDLGMFVDAHLYPIGGLERQYLSKVTVAADLITFHISDQNAERCTGSFNPLVPVGTISLTDAYGRPAGILLGNVQQLPFLTAWTLGEHVFAQADTPFASTVIHPMPESGVRGFLVDGTLFAGDVWLVGGEGVVLTGPEANVIRVDVPGDPYYAQRRCEIIEGEHKAPEVFLRSIAGILPNAVGNIGIFPGTNVTEDTTFRAVPFAGGIRLEFVGTRSSGGIYVRD